jgi:hypothetical protein
MNQTLEHYVYTTRGYVFFRNTCTVELLVLVSSVQFAMYIITHTKFKATRLMIRSLYQGNFFDHSRAGCNLHLAKNSDAKEIQWSMVARWTDIHAGSSWATL